MPETAPPRRRGGRRSGRGREGGQPPEAEAPAQTAGEEVGLSADSARSSRRRRPSRGGAAPQASTAATTEVSAAAAETLPPAETPAPAEKEKPRRGRGRRQPRRAETAEPAAALEAATREIEAPPPAVVAEPQVRPAREAPSRRGRGRGRREQPSPAARGEQPAPREGRGGTVESLVARQNVLFEEFAGQQEQTLREIQRSLQNIARGAGGATDGGVVAPIILPKVGVFLDVPNVIYAAEDLGVRVHFGKLLDYLTKGRQLVRATAYAPVTDDPNTRFENQRFVQPVLGHGYKVVTKPWKRFADGGMKANFDIELAVDILTMSDRLDIVVLLSGDSDFKRVIELVESKGVRVEVCAFAQSTASELRAVADYYIDLGSILQHVGA